MPLGVYTCNRQFTQDQREMDQTYGIFEVQNRILQFTQDNSFKFTYHYYYEHQKFYTMVKQYNYDLIISGTYVEAGAQIVATVVAGEYNHGDEMAGKKEEVKEITGKLVFAANGGNIEVVSTHFDKKVNRGGMIQSGFVFKKKQ